MKPNKSIDGLVIRDAQKPVPARKTTPALKPKKTSVAKTSSTAKKATTPKTKSAKPTKTINKSKTIEPVKVAEPARTAPEQTVEDFLKPVHAFNFDEETGELQAMKDTPKPTTETKPKKEKKKPSKARRIIVSIVLFIVLALVGFITWAIFWGNDIIAKITGGQGNVLDLIKFVEPTYNPLKTDANGRTNILAFGTSGYNMEGDEGNGVHDGAQLTDSIMMISLNQETGDVAMLSLPRDLKSSTTCTATGKINEVYWCNGGGADITVEEETLAATALMNEVGTILGVDFQYYAHLNWGSLVSIVDILDGITITLDEGIYDYYWTGAVYEPGVEYTLNGEEALGLARARHGTTGGDFSRGASQQKILIGIKDKAFEKQLSVTDVIDIASTLGDNLRTNFSLEEIKSLAHLTADFDFENMRQLTLYPDYMTTGSINDISYVLPRGGVGNYGAIQEYVSENLSNDPRVYEHPTILVLNATDTDGAASDERLKLTDAGYTVTDIDNAPEDITVTENYLIYSSGIKKNTENMLKTYYNVDTTPLTDAPESITRDYDFVIILGPTPTESAWECFCFLAWAKRNWI